MKELTLGSLFDGSGGFPLGGILAGITPIWASEIEPFPIMVTKNRLPFMKHYGDISQMNGGEVEPVDIITFGSPCQDMSVAGKRDGLDGSRSSLFYEAVRIVKEMRKATNGKYPRYIVWENVTGAFSSNKGEDFRCVLESICKIKDESISIPRPRKWLSAGEIVGNCPNIGGVDCQSHGGSSMLNIGEYPKEENVSTLSQILQDGVPDKYCLSPKACLGILRRASERGKELPSVLKKALLRKASELETE